MTNQLSSLLRAERGKVFGDSFRDGVIRPLHDLLLCRRFKHYSDFPPVATVNTYRDDSRGRQGAGDTRDKALSKSCPPCDVADGSTGISCDVLKHGELARTHAIIARVAGSPESNLSHLSREPVEICRAHKTIQSLVIQFYCITCDGVENV